KNTRASSRRFFKCSKPSSCARTRSCSLSAACADSGRSQKSGLLDCSRSWVWRAVRLGTSKTPPEFIGALFEIGHLLSYIAKHNGALCHKFGRDLTGLEVRTRLPAKRLHGVCRCRWRRLFAGRQLPVDLVCAGRARPRTARLT